MLGYQVQDAAVAEFVKRYLQSVCASADTPTDYKIEAGELLRRHSAPRVVSETVRSNYEELAAPAEPPLIPLDVSSSEQQEQAQKLS